MACLGKTAQVQIPGTASHSTMFHQISPPHNGEVVKTGNYGRRNTITFRIKSLNIFFIIDVALYSDPFIIMQCCIPIAN